MTTRRGFLTGCSILAATTVFKPSMLWAATTLPRMLPSGAFRLEYFAPHVGTKFRLARNGLQTVRLELTEAQSRPDPSLQGAEAWESGQRRFSLLFRGPRDADVKQQAHRLDHATLGPLELFLVPVLSRDTSHRYYEAIFNSHVWVEPNLS